MHADAVGQNRLGEEAAAVGEGEGVHLGADAAQQQAMEGPSVILGQLHHRQGRHVPAACKRVACERWDSPAISGRVHAGCADAMLGAQM